MYGCLACGNNWGVAVKIILKHEDALAENSQQLCDNEAHQEVALVLLPQRLCGTKLVFNKVDNVSNLIFDLLFQRYISSGMPKAIVFFQFCHNVCLSMTKTVCIFFCKSWNMILSWLQSHKKAMSCASTSFSYVEAGQRAAWQLYQWKILLLLWPSTNTKTVPISEWFLRRFWNDPFQKSRMCFDPRSNGT